MLEIEQREHILCCNWIENMKFIDVITVAKIYSGTVPHTGDSVEEKNRLEFSEG